MTTKAEFASQRVTAGTRYQAAVNELLAAMVDLAALDRTVANRNVGGEEPLKSFVCDLQYLPSAIAHPVFVPFVGGGRRLEDQIRTQADTYISQLT